MTESDVDKLVACTDTAKTCNRRLALAIRKVSELHEASYVGDEEYKANPHLPYRKSYYDCIREVVGNDPIATILDCLFTTGYCEMFEFADTVLEKEQSP